MTEPRDSDVYVDVLFDDGLLYFVICNDGAQAARRVRISFDRPVIGTDGVDITKLGAFNRLEFLAPGKRIPVLIDRARSYYRRRQRSVITMKLSWSAGRRTFSTSISHDMRAYIDLPYAANQPDPRRIDRLRR